MNVSDVVDILLVEDDAVDEELTVRALRGSGFVNRIVVARDGAEAIRCLEEPFGGEARVVLLDLKLPKIDGIGVLRAIRANPRTRRLPVVVLTSSREEPDIAKCYELGVNSYVVKPVEFEAFVKAVSDIGLYWLLVNQPPPT